MSSILKQALDAMKLHTAETHPLVETERAMEAIEAELAKPQTMRPAELAERLKRGEKWAVGQKPAAKTDGQDERFERTLKKRTDEKSLEPPLRQPLTTDEYIQALGPLLSQIVCSSGTLRCIVRTIEAQHDIKEQP